MTTLRPHIIRADTIDLQAQDAPSAKDHTRQPTHPAPIGVGPPAPHQNLTLKNVETGQRLETEALQEQMHSPRTSEEQTLDGETHDDSDYYDDPNLAPNGHGSQQDSRSLGGSTMVGDDGEVGDQDGDDGLDDDMMDKISSSPSIDDGGYPFPYALPSRAGSLDTGLAHSPLSSPSSVANNCSSSSPFTSTPYHFPLSPIKETESSEPDDHHHGEYLDSVDDIENKATSQTFAYRALAHTLLYPETSNRSTEALAYCVAVECQGGDEAQDLRRFLLPEDDPLIDNGVDSGLELTLPDSDDSSWEDESDDSVEDDGPGNFHFSEDPRFIDSGWGGECLRDVEDIDFEFVYALHTFVATVEGQANATKGDTMVLLDDSNSYWWLVRVVKDGSYLPAEHIETPTERLARLNKHRNIDLSATMLGDNPEKSKNPLKKAMRRRNAKTVQFAPPQYFEPSDFDYSSDEEGGEGVITEEAAAVQAEPQNGPEKQNDTAVVEPLRVKPQSRTIGVNGQLPQDISDTVGEGQDSPDRARTSDELLDKQDPANVRSRTALVRNTDSFFKDDNVETKKISLTPRLLSEQGNGAPGGSSESQTRSSLDTFDKVTASANDKSRDDKKRKDKKPGMLSGLFKRKDKKDRGQEDRGEEHEKVSEDSSRASPQPKASSESLSQDVRLAPKPQSTPQRQPSKLQKPPPADLSPVRQAASQRPEPLKVQTPGAPQPSSPQKENSGPSTLRQVGPEPQTVENSPAPLRVRSPEAQPATNISLQANEKSSIFSPFTSARKTQLATSPAEPTIKPVKSKKAASRFAIDDSESDEDEPISHAPAHIQYHTQDAAPPEAISRATRDRLSESPVQVSPIEPAGHNPFSDPAPPPSHPPPLAPDSSPTDDEAPISPISPSPSPSPDLVESIPNYSDSVAKDVPTPASTATSTPTWSDASLRTYLDSDGDADIKDLLMIVHDNSGVVPAGPDHPIIGNLFKDERQKMSEMERKLDGMLESWLARKGKARSADMLPA